MEERERHERSSQACFLEHGAGVLAFDTDLPGTGANWVGDGDRNHSFPGAWSILGYAGPCSQGSTI
jgi:hypothetical protein